MRSLPLDIPIPDDEFSQLFSIPTHCSKQGRNRILGAAFEEYVVNNLVNNSGKIYDSNYSNRELADACVEDVAIEIKYRYNSNDAKQLRGVDSIGMALANKGYQPVLLICHQENSPTYIKRASKYFTVIQGFNAVNNFISTLNSTQPTT